jgi:DNA-binding Lrp family transcriptional regulator
MVKLDEIDKLILTLLGINSAASASQISNILREMDKTITDRAVLQRIARLKEKKIIQGYTTILQPDIIAEKTRPLCKRYPKITRRARITYFLFPRLRVGT